MPVPVCASEQLPPGELIYAAENVTRNEDFSDTYNHTISSRPANSTPIQEFMNYMYFVWDSNQAEFQEWQSSEKKVAVGGRKKFELKIPITSVDESTICWSFQMHHSSRDSCKAIWDSNIGFQMKSQLGGGEPTDVVAFGKVLT